MPCRLLLEFHRSPPRLSRDRISKQKRPRRGGQQPPPGAASEELCGVSGIHPTCTHAACTAASGPSSPALITLLLLPPCSMSAPLQNAAAGLSSTADPHKAGLWASSPRARATQTFKAHTFAVWWNLNWSIVRLFLWGKDEASLPLNRCPQPGHAHSLCSYSAGFLQAICSGAQGPAGLLSPPPTPVTWHSSPSAPG